MNNINKVLKVYSLLGFTAGLFLVSETAISDDSAHYVGLSYVSGTKDIWDWHENNLYLDEFEHGEPIAISYRYAKLYNSGIRLDVGIGPYALVMGDVEYVDVPIHMSIGYSFLQSSTVRPYARLGASLHMNDGDYLNDEQVIGTVAAIGFEIGDLISNSFFVEASYDNAEASFSDIKLDENHELIRVEEDILLNGFMLTLGARF